MKKIALYFLVSLLLFSCNNKQEKAQNLITEKIKGTEIKIEEENPLYTIILDSVDSLFFVAGGFSDKTELLNTYILSGNILKKEKNFVKEGKGPFEFEIIRVTHNDLANMSDTVYISDFHENKFFAINNKDFYDKDKWKKLATSFTNKMRLPTATKPYVFLDSDKILMISGKFDEETIISTYNIHTQELKGTNYWIEDDSPLKNFTKQDVYTSNSTVYKHPTKDVFVYACGIGGQYVETFELEGEKVKNRKVIIGEKPIYELRRDGLNFTIKPSERTKPLGIKYVIPTEKYLYIMSNSVMFDEDYNFVSYKGYSYQHNDLFKVFDWQGNHIKNIELEFPARYLHWDKKHKVLYTTTESQDPDKSDILMSYELE